MESERYLQEYAKLQSLNAKDALFQEAIDLENVDRGLFSRKRESWDVPELEDPYKSLIPCFDNTGNLQIVKKKFNEKPTVPMLFKSDEENDIHLVQNLTQFKECFLNFFCEGVLRDLCWDNLIAAGGSISGCMQCIPTKYQKSYEKRKYLHDIKFPSSDIDLFIWGLDSEAANKKLLEIYETISNSCPFQVVCFRSANAISLVSQYPYRHVQIILRLYSSPYEILAGFDVDSCTFLFDGSNVYTTPRGHHAVTSGYNTVDMSRRSLSYEIRLAKYASRGFAVAVPGYDPQRVDPNNFEKPFNMLRGLAKLLVLDKLRTPESRLAYQDRQRAQAQKPTLEYRFRDSRLLERIEKLGGELSDYSTVFLPWGPNFNAKATVRLMKTKDRTLNGPWFARDRSYRLHPCFYGTMEEVIQDCSPGDPPVPDDVPRESIRKYVSGPVSWLEDDPGRQEIGSFHPVTNQDWESGAYCLSSMEELFQAINRNDAQTAKSLAQSVDPFMRDFLGRPPINFAIVAGAESTALALLETNLDPTLKLPDHKNCLHLCVFYNMPKVAEALIKRVQQLEKEPFETPPSQRTWSVSEFVNCEDKISGMTPIACAIRFGNLPMVKLLLPFTEVNTQVSIELKSRRYGRETKSSPMLLVSVPETADEILECLFQHGMFNLESTVSSQDFYNIFHYIAESGNEDLAKLIIEKAKKHNKDLLRKLMLMVNNALNLPIASAISACAKGFGTIDLVKLYYATAPILMPDEAMCSKIRIMVSKLPNNYIFGKLTSLHPDDIESPLTLVVDHFKSEIENLKEEGEELVESSERVARRCFDLFKWLMQEDASLPQRIDKRVRLKSNNTGLPKGDEEYGKFIEFFESRVDQITKDGTRWAAIADSCYTQIIDELLAQYDSNVISYEQVVLQTSKVIYRDSYRSDSFWTKFTPKENRREISLFYLNQIRRLAESDRNANLIVLESNSEPIRSVESEAHEHVSKLKAEIVAECTRGFQLNRAGSLGEAHQSVALSLYKSVCALDAEELEELMSKVDEFPILSIRDSLSNNIVSAYGASLVARGHYDRSQAMAVLKALTNRAELEYRQHQVATKKHQGTLDNYKLMEDDYESDYSGEFDYDSDATPSSDEDGLGAHHAMNMHASQSDVHIKDILTMMFSVPSSMVKPMLPVHLQSHCCAEMFRMNILRAAILTNDVDLVSYILELASNWEDPYSPLNSRCEIWARSEIDLVIALDRVEILKVFARMGCVGIDLETLARGHGLAFIKVAKSSDASSLGCYRGLSSVLDRAVNTTEPVRDESVPDTWIERALFYGARDVLKWLDDVTMQGTPIFDLFLSKDSKRFDVKCLNDFAGKLSKKLGSNQPPGVALMQCVCGSLRSTVKNTKGRTLWYYAISGFQPTVVSLIQSNTDIVRQPIAFGINNSEATLGPIFAALQGYNPKAAIEYLIRDLKADALEIDPKTGNNIFQYSIDKYDRRTNATEGLAEWVLETFPKYCSAETMNQLMLNSNHDGLNAFMQICYISDEKLKKVLFQKFFIHEWSHRQDSSGKTLLHHDCKNEQRLAQSWQWLEKNHYLEEDFSGQNPVDMVVRNRVAKVPWQNDPISDELLAPNVLRARTLASLEQVQVYVIENFNKEGVQKACFKTDRLPDVDDLFPKYSAMSHYYHVSIASQFREKIKSAVESNQTKTCKGKQSSSPSLFNLR